MAAAVIEEPEVDPTRWVTLVIAILSAFIVVLDNTVLNVSIPTMLRDLHTNLPSLEWVITGYALTFAALLIIGGRLGDVYGHRRIFIIGAALFGAGSLLASVSTSVGELILGEAVIEGIGASFMLPATLAILSSTFRGKERAAAFAAWGATAGVAAAAGPVVGGFLTTNYSWRWSFRINVIIAPLAVIGALLFMKRAVRTGQKVRIDLPGAVMIAVGMFLLVFALSQGGLYGWWSPLKDFSVNGHVLWEASAAVSMIPVIFALAAAVLGGFVWFELRKGRAGGDPLFQFKHFRLKTYRYGLLTSMVLAMGQLGMSFVLPVFLQDAKHLTAATNGLWMLPSGIFVIIGAQVAGLLIRRYGTTYIVRVGLVLYATGLMLILRVISLDITAWSLLPGLALYGAGIGFAGAQLTNVVLSEIPADSSGVASGTNTTMRQVGSALGVSVIGSLLTVQSIKAATTQISASALSPAVKASTLAGVHTAGSGYSPPPSLSPGDASTVQKAIEHGVTTGTRFALLFAVGVIIAGTLLSFLIPRDQVDTQEHRLDGPAEALDAEAALIGELA
ncbi:MAG TPA: MFS transporter [Acidimicrobiales bacterium]|nr:MFS transporter [Acidimicrobiales bacterium]